MSSVPDITDPALAAPLPAADEAFLDKYGNQNGSFDVGDLRAYLADNPVR